LFPTNAAAARRLQPNLFVPRARFVAYFVQ
jgi:hypothetical protein